MDDLGFMYVAFKEMILTVCCHVEVQTATARQ